MHAILLRLTPAILLLSVLLAQGCNRDQKNIERPEKIYSKRLILYDDSTYLALAGAWERYNAVYPSEEACANWMYAMRYAGLPDYASRLAKGAEKYPANPTLLYLSGLLKMGKPHSNESRQLLEKASALDPGYDDPWYGLIGVYMEEGDRERTDVALRHLLSSGAIADEVMDFSYNLLASLDKNAILITNGDNDTYPGWILTRILRFRPDVRIVNRSLLNTEWYPGTVMREGVPTFITEERLRQLRQTLLEQLKANRSPSPGGGPFGDTLIVQLVGAAAREGRPVYFSCTLMPSEIVTRCKTGGRNLGLVTRVTPSAISYAAQVRQLLDVWLKDYRTGGLDSWQLRHAKQSRAGRRLVTNYASALQELMDFIVADAPEYRLPLFRWYQSHLLGALPIETVDEANRMWCRQNDPPEIREWCRSRGYSK